jgi:hypothetical protein
MRQAGIKRSQAGLRIFNLLRGHEALNRLPFEIKRLTGR